MIPSKKQIRSFERRMRAIGMRRDLPAEREFRKSGGKKSVRIWKMRFPERSDVVIEKSLIKYGYQIDPAYCSHAVVRRFVIAGVKAWRCKGCGHVSTDRADFEAF